MQNTLLERVTYTYISILKCFHKNAPLVHCSHFLGLHHSTGILNINKDLQTFTRLKERNKPWNKVFPWKRLEETISQDNVNVSILFV